MFMIVIANLNCKIPYTSGLFSKHLYFANFAKIKLNSNVEEAQSVSPFVKLLFANKNLFVKYKRLENNPL